MKPKIDTCPCKFDNREEEGEARKQFLKQYGDDLPDEVIKTMGINT